MNKELKLNKWKRVKKRRIIKIEKIEDGLSSKLWKMSKILKNKRGQKNRGGVDKCVIDSENQNQDLPFSESNCRSSNIPFYKSNYHRLII